MNRGGILALVLAGGEGRRLYPLTADHAKPAVPFVGGYRLIDFVLSSLINSQVTNICVLTQYKPRSLIEHIKGLAGPWSQGISVHVRVAPADGGGGYKGTADAVCRNIDLVERYRPELVAVFAADHVYRMDVRQMADFHRRQGADASVAAIPLPIEKASSFGVLVTDTDGRIRDFQEKPAQPRPLPADPGRAYVSMGNYLFDPQLLLRLGNESGARRRTDFGHHLLPYLVNHRRVYAYDFLTNRVPGLQPFEERGYWRDVGTLASLEAAKRDVSGPCPRFALDNRDWPLHGQKLEQIARFPGRRERGTRPPAGVVVRLGTTAGEGKSLP